MNWRQAPLVLALAFANAAGAETTEAEFAAAAERQMRTPSRYPVPAGHAPGFSLSLDWPAALEPEDHPWDGIDFAAEPERYMDAVLGYVLEGNLAVDWRVQDNRVRRWYHAPWMHYGRRGREPIHGLTRERRSRPFELHPDQSRDAYNWAVGFYNPAGGYTVGHVWADPARPATADVTFPAGTVAAKLLFTDASDEQVPYLAGSKTWFAQVRRDAAPVEMRLLQVDFAVRDDRAAPETGWVFGTFMYRADADGADAWSRLVPVGLHWGNDPGRTPGDFADGAPLSEGWLNPAVADLFATLPRRWLGLWGRVNGPVDSPDGTCLACHSRALDVGETGHEPPFTPDLANPAAVRHYFRNRKPDEPFYPGFRSLDYSLQLADGVASFREWVRTEHPGFVDPIYGKPDIASAAPLPPRRPPVAAPRPKPRAHTFEWPFVRGHAPDR